MHRRTLILAGLTIVFLLAVVTLQPFAVYSGAPQTLFVLVSLLVCLIPTTIGGLLSAIGIAGMDRLVRHNVLAMSGRAVEAAGDVDTLLLDKTGTITLGNRQAAAFLPATGVAPMALADAAQWGVTSMQDNSDWEDFLVYEQLEREGKLTARITEWLPFGAPLEVLKERRAAHPADDPMLHTGMLKGFMDGSLGSHTAAMLAPYTDEPKNSGLPQFEQPKIVQQEDHAEDGGAVDHAHARRQAVDDGVRQPVRAGRRPRHRAGLRPDAGVLPRRRLDPDRHGVPSAARHRHPAARLGLGRRQHALAERKVLLGRLPPRHPRQCAPLGRTGRLIERRSEEGRGCGASR